MVEQGRLVRGRRGVCGLCLKRDAGEEEVGVTDGGIGHCLAQRDEQGSISALTSLLHRP